MNNSKIDKIMFDQITRSLLYNIITFIKEIKPPVSRQLGGMHHYDLYDMEI